MRIIILATTLALAVAGSVSAIPFGADLSRPADNTGACSLLFSDSCTFFSGGPGPSSTRRQPAR